MQWVGAFDVVNLETRGLNADFTGTRIEADAPIAVFTGSEAGDVPFFETYMRRQCCADHLEEQLPPDDLAGRRFLVGAHLPRSAALGRAMSPPSEVEYDEPFWVRVVPVGGDAQIRTTLEAPHAAWTLRAGTATLIEARESFLLEVTSEAGAVHVLQALPGQEAAGISGAMPGGDPSIVVVPPIERFTTSHVFAVPPGYAFDFVTVLSPSGAATSLDGVPLDAVMGPDGEPACRRQALDGFVVWQCQLSFPIVTESTVVEIDPGAQADGFHEITSTAPVGAILTGFRDFVSYGFPAGFGPSGPRALTESRNPRRPRGAARGRSRRRRPDRSRRRSRLRSGRRRGRHRSPDPRGAPW